jgi:hypothetical protein
MAEEFEKLLGPMQPDEKDEALQAKIDEAGVRMMSDAWLYQKGRRVLEFRIFLLVWRRALRP